ncbi:MAG: hypothetical protein K0U38_02305 [Epsilonproteobacteria bacterium]|nr:hypothetical protein [Campylobacterota bacterium]
MVAILFEGKSDGKFFDDILDRYELPKEQVAYYDFKGKDNIFNIGHAFYDEIENDINNIGRIHKLFIVVDADNPKDPNINRGYAASETKLKEVINNLDFNISIEYHIMCDENQEGYLESFLLSVLDDKQKECIDTFKSCFSYELTDKWVYNSFYKHNRHPFDFNHPNFNELKQKLKNLFKEQK